MKYTWRNKKKTYYVLFDKRRKSIKISTTKQYAADEMGINVRTINRNMSKSGIYENKEHILWIKIPITKCIKGFALHT